MITAISERLHARSAALLLSLEMRLGHVLMAWLFVMGFACAARLTFAQVRHGSLEINAVTPYLLIVLAPLASTLLALRWFENGEAMPQPTVRIAVLGRWDNLERIEARRHTLYGTSGLMVSLMVGIMLNAPLRAVEYLAIMPPLASTAPHWLATLNFMMTLDVVLFSSLYMVAFVAALRRVPLFPRLLTAIWMADLAMQTLVARTAGGEALPPAVAGALHDLLNGNIKKVLISISLWLPYLLLSKRVNLTYRLRAVS